jgi:hypothetical protein
MSPLITSSAEVALHLIEKNGVLVPFCKLTDSAGGTMYIQPDSGTDADDESMLLELQRRLDAEQVKEFALCADVQVKFKGIPGRVEVFANRVSGRERRDRNLLFPSRPSGRTRFSRKLSYR